MTARPSPRDRLIVALDLPNVEAARAMVARLGDAVGFYKIGMELVYGGGLDLVRELAGEGKQVFLDLKLHDIPVTVAKATAQVARLGATFLTVHAYPQTMRAAREAAEGTETRILGVTVLTSMGEDDLAEAGYAAGVADTVARRAAQAREIGIGGLVMSPEEAGAMRAIVGPELVIVTPGIRPRGAAIGDQKRVMTPERAIAEGADYLVVGRPVTQGESPAQIAGSIVAEIETGLRARSAASS